MDIIQPVGTSAVKTVQNLDTKRYFWCLIGLSMVLIISFAVRIYNLNYNSPFADEASNIVVGRPGMRG